MTQHNKILTAIVLLWAAFAVGYFGYRFWQSKQPIVYGNLNQISQEEDLAMRQKLFDEEMAKREREYQAGRHLMEMHELKHKAIEERLNDKKR